MNSACIVACIGAVIASLSADVAAQAYPGRPLRWVIPFPPGGGADYLARIVGQKAGEALGQQIVIDNRGGAAGNIAAEVAARAAPDGHTLLQANVSHAISASLYRKLSYDLARDFVPVTQLASIPFVLTVNLAVPAASLGELIALAKAKPGALNYASSGNGGPSHMSMELLKSMAGVDLRHVPYKGGALATTDLIAGRVQALFMTVAVALPHVNGGRVRALGVTSAQRVQSFPRIPTIAEAGVPGYEMTTWFGVMAPRGTPPQVVEKLHGVFTQALAAPDVRERVANQGFAIVGSSPREFAAFVKAEMSKWAEVVKSSGAKVD